MDKKNESRSDPRSNEHHLCDSENNAEDRLYIHFFIRSSRIQFSRILQFLRYGLLSPHLPPSFFTVSLFNKLDGA